MIVRWSKFIIFRSAPHNLLGVFMRQIALLSCFIVGFGFSGFGQEVITIKGFLKDSLTNEPITNASILYGSNKRTKTKSDGYFTFTVKVLPVVLTVSHTSYGVHDIRVESIPENEDLIILLTPYTHQIKEVTISSERLRILSKKSDYSIGDMAVDRDHLWMIIYTNNITSQSRLCLADNFGDTLKTIAISYPASFFKDVFGNVHLEIKDSIYQLYSPDNQSIYFIYGEDREVFHEVTDQYVAGFGNKLVSCKYSQADEKAVVSYVDESNPGGHFLTQILDSQELIRKKHDIMAGSMWLELKSKRYWRKDTKIARIYEGNVKAPMFSLNDTLYILNSIKDSLLRYNPDGKWIGAVPVRFHKDTIFWGEENKNISFLADNSTNSCFILERQNAGWAINRLNFHTGKVEKRIPLPNYPGMTRITIFKNAIYFLYDQKSYPYFVRLFRFQL